MRCMNSPEGWNGWDKAPDNESKTGFENYLIWDVAAGEAGAAEALRAFRELYEATKRSETGGLYEQWLFEAEYRGLPQPTVY
jgi:hypothetical protein